MRLSYPNSDPMNYIAKINLNSLYGKLGMKDEFDIIKIMTSKEFKTFTDKMTDHLITEVIPLDNHYIVQIKDKTSHLPDDLKYKDYNINVAIASAITSYARDYMSQFKNHPKLKLFYTDTDSIYTNLNPDQMNELFPGIVNSKGLGKLKLETISSKAIFLAPKCYCLQTIEGEFIYKIKGLSKDVNITIDDFLNLLEKESLLVKNQSKWFKSLSEGSIKVLEQSYTLQQTDNKRQLVYDTITNKLIGTTPYHIDDTKTI
jgi:DNA polymerase type B, organellar and viral